MSLPDRVFIVIFVLGVFVLLGALALSYLDDRLPD